MSYSMHTYPSASVSNVWKVFFSSSLFSSGKRCESSLPWMMKKYIINIVFKWLTEESKVRIFLYRLHVLGYQDNSKYSSPINKFELSDFELNVATSFACEKTHQQKSNAIRLIRSITNQHGQEARKLFHTEPYVQMKYQV